MSDLHGFTKLIFVCMVPVIITIIVIVVKMIII